MEFKELTKRDALESLEHEVTKLKRNSKELSDTQLKTIDKEFEGFTNLFAKFLAADAQEAVKWDDIEKLPQDAVSERTRRREHIDNDNMF